jgi:phosphatidylinositol glycan class W
MFEEPTAAAFAADFLLNVGTILLATTLYSSAPATLIMLLVCSTFMYRFSPGVATQKAVARPPTKNKSKDDTSKQELSQFPVRPFLTAYRGSMMVVTCSSILAVDFPVFPRRFAKVETWGTSLMDIGVGSFVFSAGLVAAKGVIRDRLLAQTADGRQKGHGVVSRAVVAARQALPLVVLGMVRLVSVKNLDYAEHVSEYGVHWNFFFTMAVVPLALAIVQPVINLIPGPAYAIAALMLSAGYEVALESTGLKAWALTAPRSDILAQNKEGIVSSLGYVAIFLLGMSTGTVALPRDYEQGGLVARLLDFVGVKAKKNASHSQNADVLRYRLIARLALASAFFWALLAMHSTPSLFPRMSVPVSRRLANFPYVLWIAAFNTAQITLYCLVETAFFPEVRRAKTAEAEKLEASRATSKALDDFNAGGLAVFLVANLGTGLVNMSLNTLGMSAYRAMAVLLAYMGVLTLSAKYLRGIKLKL